MFEHVADHVDPRHELFVDHDSRFAGVAQHFHHLAADGAEAGHHDGAAAADRRGQALDLGQIGVSADRDQDRARLDAGVRTFDGGETPAAPLADDGDPVAFPQVQSAQRLAG